MPPGSYVRKVDRNCGTAYRFAVEEAIVQRRPAAVFIDEAQHLLKLASGRKLLDQMDVIKSIVDETSTLHALFGTYDLLMLRDLSDQLSRRCIDVHFPRYRAEQKGDRQSFINSVFALQEDLPIPVSPDLPSQWDFLYERSLGCIGILKDWLVDALEHALRLGEKVVTTKHLGRHAPSLRTCDEILNRILEGETRLIETNKQEQGLRIRLGLDVQTSDSPQLKSTAKRRHQLPGTPSPRRQPIGIPV